MKVHEWLKQHPNPGVTVNTDAVMEQILSALLSHADAREIYVVDDRKRIIGHISYQKIARLVLAEHTTVQTRSQIMERITCGSAIDLMDTHFNSASPDEEMDDILQLHLDHLVEEMPIITAEGELLGVVCLRDVLKAYL